VPAHSFGSRGHFGSAVHNQLIEITSIKSNMPADAYDPNSPFVDQATNEAGADVEVDGRSIDIQ
jgi:hypothetical protein